MSTNKKFSNVKLILTDIEGTTSSIGFVHEVLFPYSKSRLESYISQNLFREEIRRILFDVLQYPETKHFDQQFYITKHDAILVTAFTRLHQWIEQDLKIKPLKELQGLIWQDGYRNGDYRGHVYEDAVIALKSWFEKGFRIAIFSSGSVQAQQLIFGYSEYGDLNHLFSGYFDTRVGSKKDPAAYNHIVHEINEFKADKISASEILFLSDVLAELEAAQMIGMQVLQLARADNPVLITDPAIASVTDFSQIELI